MNQTQIVFTMPLDEAVRICLRLALVGLILFSLIVLVLILAVWLEHDDEKTRAKAFHPTGIGQVPTVVPPLPSGVADKNSGSGLL